MYIYIIPCERAGRWSNCVSNTDGVGFSIGLGGFPVDFFACCSDTLYLVGIVSRSCILRESLYLSKKKSGRSQDISVLQKRINFGERSSPSYSFTHSACDLPALSVGQVKSSTCKPTDPPASGMLLPKAEDAAFISPQPTASWPPKSCPSSAD